MTKTSFGSRRSLRWLIACAMLIAAGCGEKTETAAQAASATGAANAAADSAQQPEVPPAAAPVTQASWSPDALEELVAPIALYPDQLVGQILAASVNAQEVLDAGNWLLQNQNLTGDQLDAAAQAAGFGPAMRALVQFPTVVDMMCQQIDWTRQLGSAFTSDQKSVLDAVQRLRLQAKEVGNLKSTPQQTVETSTENGNVIVEVKPADPTIVYVPQYNPQVVYTTPPPATTTTESTVSTDTAVAAGLLAFGVGILVGNAMNDHDDCYPHWGYGAVYYGPRPFYPPAYAYRPVYGPAFRPAYRYNSPPGYRYGYNNKNNVVINNGNYYNRFDHNQNLKASNTRQANNQNWRGQSTYAGTRDAGTAQRPSSGASAATRPAQGAGSRPQASTMQSNRSNARVDRGYGDAGGPQSRPSAQQSRPASQQSRPAQPTQVASAPGRDSAFSGASKSGTGSFDRAASARGRASTASRQARSGGASRSR